MEGGKKKKKKAKTRHRGKKNKTEGQIPFIVQLLRRDVRWPLLCGRNRNREKMLSCAVMCTKRQSRRERGQRFPRTTDDAGVHLHCREAKRLAASSGFPWKASAHGLPLICKAMEISATACKQTPGRRQWKVSAGTRASTYGKIITVRGKKKYVIKY